VSDQETTTMTTGNIIGVDPHRRRFTATILDERGLALATEHFSNDTAGYLDSVEWAKDHGAIDRWGIENAASFGRHLSEFLIADGFDVRDVPPHRTARRGRGRHEGKSDIIDSHRIAHETQSNPQLSRAFKRSQPDQLDPVREQMALWHNARKSLTRVRVQLLGEIDMLIHELPEHLRTPITACKTVRAKVTAFKRADWDLEALSPSTGLRVRLIAGRIDMLEQVLDEDKTAAAELARLVADSGSTLTELVGIAPRAAAEILIETGEIARFTEAGFARYTGTAPVPASSGEGGGQPVRHRLSRGGNRRLNAALHRMAMIQLRFEPRARALYDNARAGGHTKREAMRILKRHLASVVYRTMRRDAQRTLALT
jgi:transposase